MIIEEKDSLCFEDGFCIPDLRFILSNIRGSGDGSGSGKGDLTGYGNGIGYGETTGVKFMNENDEKE
jgi:hypothetical protein